MIELISNIHIHTKYSDGTGTHKEIALSGINAGLDMIIITDHNVLVKGLEGYYHTNLKNILLMTGEEVHDQTRSQQKNHILIIGCNHEMAGKAGDIQELINDVNKNNGLTFYAHPFENALPLFNESDISWIDWNLEGFTGIEIWNGLSEIKNFIHHKIDAIFFALFPQFIARSPNQESLNKWDQLLASGKKVVAVGGTDAHMHQKTMGPLKATIFPYEFHFRTINNHLFVPEKLSLNLDHDKDMILEAFRKGHLFIGYDLPYPTTGFRFSAEGDHSNVIMGESIELGKGVIFNINLPNKATCKLIKDGSIIRTWKNQTSMSFVTNQAGVFRVECEIPYLLKNRGWIYSNPIFVI